MWVIAIVVGAFAGAAMNEGFFGAVVGGLIAWLLLRSHAQSLRIEGLLQALTELRERGLAAAPAAKAAAAAPVSAPSAAPTMEETPEPESEPEAMPDFVVSTIPAPLPVTRPSAEAAAPPPRPPLRPQRPAEPDLFDQAQAWLLGGNTIAKAGVGILFIGLAFLAKYASDHALLPVEYRLAGIAGVALVLLGLGWRLRVQRPAYAQALQGGAVAVLYLTLFVAFRFYGVLAAGPVFALMVAVAGLAAALAVLQDARTLAIIGALGGFATPLLVSTGSGNEVALFSYYLVLDLGIAAVAWWRTWRLLNAIGFVFTFGVAAAWGVLSYNPGHYLSSQVFLVAYFLLFNAVLMMPARRLQAQASRSDAWVNGGLLFGLPTLTFVLQHGLVRHLPYGTALSALVMAGFYVAMAARMKRHPQLLVTFDATLAIATVLLSLVIPFALDAHATGGAWALEGAGLAWLGLRQQRRVTRGFGYALLLLAGVTLLLARQWHGEPTAVFNAAFMNALLLAVAAIAAAYFVHRGSRAGGLMAGEPVAEPLLIGWGLLWALSAAAQQISLFVGEKQSVAAWLLALSAIAVVFMALRLRLRWLNIGLPLMGLAPLLALAVLASLALLRSPVEAGGWWAWPLALAAQALVLRFVAPDWPPAARHAAHALGPLLLAALGAQQGGAITRDWGDEASAWPWLGMLAAPALLLLLLPRPGTARLWPVRAEPIAYQATAGGVLTVALLLWTLLANGLSTGAASPLPHVPLLNPLDLGIATALFACVMWLRQDVAQSRLAQAQQVPAMLMAGVGFVWLNAILLRGFFHFGGVPYRLDEWAHSLAVQTGLTLLWSATALALMWLSARRGQRVVWMVGGVLLAAVVAKLLLVDLSGSGTVTRIVSFIGVGLLMLVIAYVAPLPSNEPARETS